MAKPIEAVPADATTKHTADTRNPGWDKYVPEGEGVTDEQIRADVHEALAGDDALSSGSLSVSVKDGLVTLAGQATPQTVKQLVDKVRALPSVRDVRDETKASG